MKLPDRHNGLIFLYIWTISANTYLNTYLSIYLITYLPFDQKLSSQPFSSKIIW